MKTPQRNEMLKIGDVYCYAEGDYFVLRMELVVNGKTFGMEERISSEHEIAKAAPMLFRSVAKGESLEASKT